MKLTVYRFKFSAQSTIGRLYVDGAFECFTLEDVPRDVKIPGETAIPLGTYPLIVNHSQRFNCDMPLLCGVPGFEGVRIHPGNTKDDTEGCILVGCGFGDDVVMESRKAFAALFPKIEAAFAGGEAIEVVVEGERLP